MADRNSLRTAGLLVVCSVLMFPGPVLPETELSAYRSLGQGEDCAANRAFVGRWPNSSFTSLVNNWIRACEELELEAANAIWKSTLDRGKCDGFRQFLIEYPDNPNVDAAQARVADCDRQDADNAAWARAKRGDNCAAYKDYLADHPKGRHLAAARRALDRCNSPAPSPKPDAPSAPAPNGDNCGQGFWSAATLKRWFGGHTWEGRAFNRLAWREYYAPDGNVYGKVRKDASWRNASPGRWRWRLEDDRYCTCSGNCQDWTCRKVKQISGCPGTGPASTWDLGWLGDPIKKRSDINRIRAGDHFDLVR